jgi:two-component system response regulator GlrR
MTRHRCTVIADRNDLHQARSLIEYLAPVSGFDVEPRVREPACASDGLEADVAIWVLGARGALDLEQWTVREDRGAPRCAVLAACPSDQLLPLVPLLGLGVIDFIVLPATANEIVLRLRRVLGQAAAEPSIHERTLDPRLRGFVGSSPAFVAQLAQLPQLAACDAGVLILGETGTGKELCAQALHYLSPRAAHPCVAVNCGGIPLELVESELFGHLKGAFTNAHNARDGLVAEAEGGTLFLDDIDCLPLAAQAKLLRFLQEHEYRPLGSTRMRRANVRVIAASNHHLPAMAARGEFRQDLYYRLNVLNLELPPLRNRREDIAPLALHFISRFARQFERAVTGLTPAALRRLMRHDWPGNVRELEHVIERAVLLAPGAVLAETDISVGDAAEPSLDAESFRAAKARVVQDFERSRIEQLLTAHAGNVTHAAAAARKNRRAFIALMQKYRIEPERFRVST